MISSIVSTTLARGGWVQIEEENQFDRVLTFQNLTDTALSIRIMHTPDGGTSWIEQVAWFTVPAYQTVQKAVNAQYPLRIEGTGKAATRGLKIGYQRVYFRANFVDL